MKQITVWQLGEDKDMLTTSGFEIRYKVLDKEHSVFQQSETNVAAIVALLKERGRVFTVRYAIVNNDTGKIFSRGCEIGGW